MFDLEKAIVEWRAQMLAAGIQTPVPLEELEAHLRDDIARQIQSGADPRDVFESAILRFGCPASLQREFKKVGGLGRFGARAKNLALSFAGIPGGPVSLKEFSSAADSRSATYFRSAVFLLPAAVLWAVAATYVAPAFNELWEQAGISKPTDLAKLLRFDLAIMALFGNNLLLIAGAVVLLLGFLEWRSTGWPRYRRAIISGGVYLVNFAVLFSLGLLFVAATFAARELAAAAKH